MGIVPSMFVMNAWKNIIRKPTPKEKINMLDISKFFNGIKRVMAPWREHKVVVGGRQYWHIKNGGKVLLVAHIDTVLQPTKPKFKKKRIKARGLDDRLGVYMAMTIQAEMPDIVDVLITDDEEIGKSTADMVPTKDLEGYNVIIELDRGGSDFVHYDLAGDDLIDAYLEFADEGYGWSSDIAHLNSPPCGCINVGIGYYKQHAKDSYAKTEEFIKAYHDVSEFIEKYQDVHFDPHVPAPIVYTKSFPQNYGHSANYYNEYYNDTYGQDQWDDDYYGTKKADPVIPYCKECSAELFFEDEIEEGLCAICEVKKQARREQV